MQSISRAWGFVKQNKWKILGAATAAAGGLVIWRARNVRSDIQQQQQRDIFWNESQQTCDQTIISFAPLVSKSLNEVTNFPDLLEQLRKPDLDRQAKLDLWEQLKVASFAQMIASVYLMSILSAYLRVTVNLISRYLYTSKQTSGSSIISFIFSFVFKSAPNEDENTIRELCSLSPETQREYLKLTDHFLKRGLPRLVETILEVAKPDLEHWSLKKECTFEDTKLMLSTLHARIQKQLRSALPGSDEDDFELTLPHMLLPLEAERFFAGKGDPIAAQVAALKAVTEEDTYFDDGVSDVEKLKLLINETRNVVESTPFALVVDSCVRDGVHIAYQEIFKAFAEVGDKSTAPKIALAKLIPLLNKHTNALLQAPENALVASLSRLGDLNDFSRRVFDDRVFEFPHRPL